MNRSSIVKLVLALLMITGFLTVQFNGSKADLIPARPLPAAFPTPVISSNIPTSVFIEQGVHGPVAARPFFDYFSWQSFVALTWPAAVGADGKVVRGVPDTGPNVGIGSPGTRVWESYKADWELFRPNGVPPSAWSSYDLPGASGTNPCGNSMDSKMMVMVTKMDSIVDGLNQALSGPLVDQGRNYVRYEIHINKPFYESTVANKWYIFSNKTKTLPDGVIEVKAAWKELVAGDNPDRYYTVNALIVEPGPTPSCRPAQMGMIGFHIANKVEHLREWVWSTFEHVDNVPEKDSHLPFNLNNGKPAPTPLPGKGYNRKPDKLDLTKLLPPITDAARDPVQVIRQTPISPAGQASPTTDQMNADWQAALAGTVWRFYKLVVTQWPTVDDGKSFKIGGKYPADCGEPFPTNNVANITMETYLQSNSCMRCHYAAANDDFSYLFAERAFRPAPLMAKGLTMANRNQRIDADRIKQSVTLTNLQEILAREQ